MKNSAEKLDAVSYFHGKEKYNCAQAVTKAFQEKLNIPEHIIESYKNKGGGKAPGGVCGSFYAAQKLFDTPEDIAALKELFVKYAGSTQCNEIRKLKKVDCTGTVALAQRIIKKLKIK
jgi:hypothetical protein